jgi:UDP-glucose 4-epimerase
VDNPIASNQANVDGTLNVLVAARDCGAKKFIFASSSAIYGDEPTLPKREDMKPYPLSPYAVGKITGEYYARIFSETCDLKAVCLRYCGEELGAGKDTMLDFNPSQLSSAKKS